MMSTKITESLRIFELFNQHHFQKSLIYSNVSCDCYHEFVEGRIFIIFIHSKKFLNFLNANYRCLATFCILISLNQSYGSVKKKKKSLVAKFFNEYFSLNIRYS